MASVHRGLVFRGSIHSCFTYIQGRIQVSRVPRLIASLGRLAASLARATHSAPIECSLLMEPCILWQQNCTNCAFCAY